METCVLVNDIEKYGGKYVATRSFTNSDVVASGDDMVKVYNEAKDKGIDDPVVFYVPEKDMVYIYLCL
ncbi:MAG: hypothetical protein A3G39_04230 [Deltaproteobacteria bacterium RIFCSPLOWO2_12_FULL_43_16]|nr:MAG: hypothetical protein A2Z89_05740 [Deltaproteobacteria bacterium GWA2_43_19]OGQ10134.1 MAG: hypothetical protein A3D30_09125 [Deltaproteobacteria bacterium RIFCSPHIGHO2_02_FULL_43_33]OGQ58799.1 MAG: hypothetical protein A3G39_04230 [Deltaproteobacteria bacterium RIFCSPLOWO2_12_FULL_43_16]HBR17112.1 hypothetical protein [Deltaproteobacteria bacterium]